MAHAESWAYMQHDGGIWAIFILTFGKLRIHFPPFFLSSSFQMPEHYFFNTSPKKWTLESAIGHFKKEGDSAKQTMQRVKEALQGSCRSTMTRRREKAEELLKQIAELEVSSVFKHATHRYTL